MKIGISVRLRCFEKNPRLWPRINYENHPPPRVEYTRTNIINLHNGNRPLLSMDSFMVFGMDTSDTLFDDEDGAPDDFFFFFGLSSTYLVADFDRPLCRYVLPVPP